MAGVALISNPYSKKNRKNPERLEKLKAIATDKSLLKFPTSFEEMDEAIEFFKSKKIDILTINGGDGTVHVALSHLIKIYGDTPLPKIGILKGGTMNQTATNLRIKGNTVSIFKKIVNKYDAGKSFRIAKKALFKVDEHYGLIFGNGIVCSFMEEYHKGGDPSPFVAFKTLLRTLGSMISRNSMYRRLFKKFHEEIIADDFSFGHKPYLAIFISSLPEMGLGFELMHRARPLTDSFHLLGIHSNASLVPQLGRVWLGRSMPPHVVDDTIGKNFYIKAAKPFKYTIDGDMYDSNGELYIEQGPTIEIIVE